MRQQESQAVLDVTRPQQKKGGFFIRSGEGTISKWGSWGIGLALALTTAWAVTRPFREHISWMDFVQEDFFYYLKVAQNVVAGHGSTFNGLVSTNGYHPLWMWTLVAFIHVCSGVQWIPEFLAGSIWAATMVTFLFARLLLKRFEVESLAATALAAYVAVYAMHVFCYCMEVTLAVPLMLALILMLEKHTWWSAEGGKGLSRGLAIGLVAAALVLSRIDTLIFVGLLALGILLQPQMRRQVRRPQIIGIMLGFLPLAAYFISNRVLFKVWMPISGMAKQLKIDHGFTSLAWKSFFGKSPVQLLNLIPILVALAVLPWLWRRLQPELQAIAPAVLTFPFIYISILSWCSDWQLWGWYFYMLRPALIVAFLVLLQVQQVRRTLAWNPILAVLVLFALTRVVSVRWNEQQPEIVDAARALQQFSLTHPGVYAMGDRSGSVGYLLSQPVVQTEGLMMDREYLSLVAQQLPIRQALAHYRVRYYVGSALEPYVGCFQALEPAQAGPHAPHLRGKFCEQPVANWTFAGVKTVVFDLQGE
jgi:hypothetical protein